MLIVHLFVSYAHVNLCHVFSSSWWRGLAPGLFCVPLWRGKLSMSTFEAFWWRIPGCTYPQNWYIKLVHVFERRYPTPSLFQTQFSPLPSSRHGLYPQSRSRHTTETHPCSRQTGNVVPVSDSDLDVLLISPKISVCQLKFMPFFFPF